MPRVLLPAQNSQTSSTRGVAHVQDQATVWRASASSAPIVMATLLGRSPANTLTQTRALITTFLRPLHFRRMRRRDLRHTFDATAPNDSTALPTRVATSRFTRRTLLATAPSL
jgi:hypothetical protein